MPGHFCTRTETVSSPYPASISTNAVTLLIVSCPMQSSATRLTSSAMTCRWSDHAWLSTTPERRAVPESQTPTNDTPLIETNVLHDGLHPALKALNLPQAGLHAFRHGCNRRWELAGLNPAVHRQQMGHSSAAMHSGEIPLQQVKQAFSRLKTPLWENMENEVAA